MARPLTLGTESEARQARDALEERLLGIDDLESRVAEIERGLQQSHARWQELAGDIVRAGETLLASRSDLADADGALHALGVRIHKLESLMAHPARRLAVLSHVAGLTPAGPAGAPVGSLRALVRARWTAATIVAGTQVGLEALADGFADGTPARFRVLARGTDRVAGAVGSEVQGGRVAGLWKPIVPEDYEFIVEVEGIFTRSGPLRVVAGARGADG